MRAIHLVALTALVLASPGSLQASEASAADYSGNYDLRYLSASTNLIVSISFPGTQAPTVDIPIAFSVTLDENEKIPTSTVDPIVATADLLLEQYAPNMPANLEAAVLQGLQTALYSAVNEINTQAEVLPDQLAAVLLNARLNTMDCTFVDVDGSGAQTRMVGTIDPVTGVMSIQPGLIAELSTQIGGTGDGNFDIAGIDVVQKVKGATIHVTGDVSGDLLLTRLQ